MFLFLSYNKAKTMGINYKDRSYDRDMTAFDIEEQQKQKDVQQQAQQQAYEEEMIQKMKEAKQKAEEEQQAKLQEMIEEYEQPLN